LPEHRTDAHRHMLELDAEQLLRQAGQIGPNCQEAVETVFEKVPHPEMGFRGCAGILRLAREYGRERLNAACGRALRTKVVRYSTIHNMLRNGLESLPDPSSEDEGEVVLHGNVRGASYYSNSGGASC
jgi:transposase